MNKKVLIIVGVVILLLLGVYFVMGKGKNGNTSGTQNTTGSATSPSSLKDLITKGVAQSCTFSDSTSRGTVYVAGGKVRGDFESTEAGKTMKNHMIVDGNTSYIWTDGEKTGFKMSFDPSATKPEASTAPTGGFDASANMNYKCGAWMNDGKMFSLPSGVNFTTFALPSMAPVKTTGTNGADKSAQCGYCSTLSGDSKTQCLSALNCN